MNQSFLYQTSTYLIVIALFILMLITHKLGHLLKQSHIKKNKITANEGLGPIEGSLLGLLALLLSFTFGMSASRYDERRQVMIEEANDIGTAVLRCDLYPDSIKKQLKLNFKDYVEARIEYYDAGIDAEKISAAKNKTEQKSAAIWSIVMTESQKPENVLRSQQMIPALNSMIDVVTTREETKNATVPESIFWLLFMLIFSASFIIGYSTNGKKVNRVLIYGFSLMTALTVFLILDLDRPRRGLINVDNTQQKIVELRALFKE
ncbi:MAG: hypothetical protein KAX93_00495 [Flavobacterium sp.]|nr:hypothetical protein [Flavobacterium sp.]MBP8156834.1 hypothetical protein [Flavobacterium sp.]